MYPQVFGKYVLERELARGGMARVVLATLRGAGGFEKKLVVKQIRDELACDDEFVRRFVEEAKTTVSLAHPNIVTVYELGVEFGTYFLAMEFVEGASLAELMRASAARLSPEEGAYVGVEVCRALDYAHRRMNVVHRDVTPRNVMVDEEGQVKVIDFGIAAPVATAPSGHGVFGSPGHMPPEQMEAKELTPAADVFAVAVLLMELWTGKAPFRRRTNEEIEEAMRGPHPRPGDSDPRLLPLDDALASAMSLNPKGRPQHADDFGRALRRFLAGVDLGDVARQLGERVRTLRTRPAPPADEPRLILQRPPSRPTATQVGTKTFAAREEVRTAALAAQAPSPEESTRRLESRRPSTGPRGQSHRPAPRRTTERIAIGVAAAALATTAFLLERGTGTAQTHPPLAVTSRPPAAPSPAPVTPEVPASVAVPAAADPPQTAPAERAQLVLLGDGTFVTVDGTPRGACPAHVALDSGAHAVVFSFPPTGESRGETVTLRAGERTTLRADFTGVTPTIRAVEHR